MFVHSIRLCVRMLTVHSLQAVPAVMTHNCIPMRVAFALVARVHLTYSNM